MTESPDATPGFCEFCGAKRILTEQGDCASCGKKLSQPSDIVVNPVPAVPAAAPMAEAVPDAKSAPALLGGLGTRLVAAMIDIVLPLIALGVALLLPDSSSRNAVMVLVGFCFGLYLISFWATTGQTIGMRSVGLRVVRASDGEPLGWAHALLRLVACYPALQAFFLGFVWAAHDPRKRGWHDLAAGSVVVLTAQIPVVKCPSCGSGAVSAKKQAVDPKTRKPMIVPPLPMLLWALYGLMGILLLILAPMWLVGFLQYGSEQQTGNVVFHYDLPYVVAMAAGGLWFTALFIRGLPTYWPSGRNRAIVCRCGDCNNEWSVALTKGPAQTPPVAPVAPAPAPEPTAPTLATAPSAPVPDYVQPQSFASVPALDRAPAPARRMSRPVTVGLSVIGLAVGLAAGALLVTTVGSSHGAPGRQATPSAHALSTPTLAGETPDQTAALEPSMPTLTSQITDETGVLASRRAEIETALDDLLSRGNVKLWVLFVPTTDGLSALDLVARIYQANGLGGNDMLLFVAVSDRTWSWYEMGATGLTVPEIDSLIGSQFIPKSQDGDYAGGIVDFATALGQQIDTNRTTATEPTATVP